jgi:outer membrane protein W
MKWMPAFGVASFLLASAASAEPMTRKGSQELAVHVSPDFEGAVGDMIFAQAAYGRFVRDRFAARATLLYTVLEDVAGEDSDYRTSEIGLAGEYHFGRGRFVPYVGLGVGWRSSQFGKVEESSLVYGPRAGIKYFVADNVAVDLEVTYKRAAADVFINDFVAEDNDLTPALGLRWFF